MTVETDKLASERFSAKEILLQLSQNITAMAISVQDIRERVIRLEAQDLPARISNMAEQIAALDQKHQAFDIRLVRIEASSGMWGKGLNVIISGLSALTVLMLAKAAGIGG